jgi:hypothetical protein
LLLEALLVLRVALLLVHECHDSILYEYVTSGDVKDQCLTAAVLASQESYAIQDSARSDAIQNGSHLAGCQRFHRKLDLPHCLRFDRLPAVCQKTIDDRYAGWGVSHHLALDQSGDELQAIDSAIPVGFVHAGDARSGLRSTARHQAACSV